MRGMRNHPSIGIVKQVDQRSYEPRIVEHLTRYSCRLRDLLAVAEQETLPQ